MKCQEQIAVYHVTCPMSGPGDYEADDAAWWERHWAEVSAVTDKVGDATGGSWISFDGSTMEADCDRPTTQFSLLVIDPAPDAESDMQGVLAARFDSVRWNEVGEQIGCDHGRVTTALICNHATAAPSFTPEQVAAAEPPHASEAVVA